MRVNWEEMKAAYLSAPAISLKQFASEKGIAYQTLKAHSAKGGWYREKQRRKQQAAEQVSARQVQPEEAVHSEERLPADLAPESAFAQRCKINDIADILLENIRQSSEYVDKPTGIYNLTTALKNVTAVLRDVNNIPTMKDERNYELTKRKLELAARKLPQPPEKAQAGGVVLLPEVTAAEPLSE
ncbi:MAG: hypothetical protein IJI67_00045 [Clostridia bacterium]|nr:hypothetical protein [Clostridia bacterium]